MESIKCKTESYQVIGTCMEVHRILGRGLLEIVYKDAMEYEFRQKGIPYERERAYEVIYKETILPHKFYADFVVYGNIILEIKAVNGIVDEFVKQTLNYMAIAKSPLGILINFGGESLEYKRLVF
ncbi:MAG: GxxExxY protein [Saprospiraceae bacterium]